jgi:hypothetical protein
MSATLSFASKCNTLKLTGRLQAVCAEAHTLISKIDSQFAYRTNRLDPVNSLSNLLSTRHCIELKFVF